MKSYLGLVAFFFAAWLVASVALRILAGLLGVRNSDASMVAVSILAAVSVCLWIFRRRRDP